MFLTLVRTHLYYHALGTSTSIFVLYNDHFLYATIISDECHAKFHLYGSSRTDMNARRK